MNSKKIFQVSTLQALAMGYSKSVISVAELLQNGDTGLGTFQDVNGEMILLDGQCFRATDDGSVFPAQPDLGVPFASACFLKGAREFDVPAQPDIAALKTFLDLRIEEDFGLNSMHIARIDGDFDTVYARSESAYESHHISLKEVLKTTQKDFHFENVKGSLICVYYPDYMDGINAPGWHLHFISEDRKLGGHVFEIKMRGGTARLDKIDRIEIQLPGSPAFDTYSLKEASAEEIKEVEQKPPQ